MKQPALSARERKLAKLAKRAQSRAYAPYSKYKVGCALEDTRGRVFLGCNVENCTYTGSVHAEVAAVVAMVAGGGSRVARVVVATQSTPPAFPCGLCLQMLLELGTKAKILAVGKGPQFRRSMVEELLPSGFSKESIG